MHHRQESFNWSRSDKVFWGDTPYSSPLPPQAGMCFHHVGRLVVVSPGDRNVPKPHPSTLLTYVLCFQPDERTRSVPGHWVQLPASLGALVMGWRCFLLAMWRYGVGLRGKRAAGLEKQFGIPREGTGPGLGSDSVVAVEQTIHGGWRLPPPVHSEVPVSSSLPFQGYCSNALMHKQRFSRCTMIFFLSIISAIMLMLW